MWGCLRDAWGMLGGCLGDAWGILGQSESIGASWRRSLRVELWREGESKIIVLSLWAPFHHASLLTFHSLTLGSY